VSQYQTIATPSPALQTTKLSYGTEFSDEQLVEQILAGNVNAYTPIMRRYNQRLFRIARSILSNETEAMDVVQEAHIKAYTKLNELKATEKLSSWLGAIARNEALMQLRKLKREIIMSEVDLEYLEAVAETSESLNSAMTYPDSVLEKKQLKALINQYVDQLPQDFRIVFVLRAVEQLSVRETAQIVGIKEETVKTRYFRAKRLLRENIQTSMETNGLKVYEFGGCHCDLIVRNVMERIQKL
jgi:RNA polymerase sigma-70 factor (ECF subfamily)